MSDIRRYHQRCLFCVTFILLMLVPLVVSAKSVAVTSSAQLKVALQTAQAGDEIVLADGTYAGTFTIGTHSGVPEKPITLRAQTRHQAIIQGSGNFADTKQFGLTVKRAYWVIDGLQITGHALGIYMTGSSAHHNEIRHNLIHNFAARGIDIAGPWHNHVHHNVVAFSPASPGYSDYGGISVSKGQSNTIEQNIVYSITNDGHMCGDAGGCVVGAKRGYTLELHEASHNLVRGNLLMDSAKGGLRIFSTPKHTQPTDHNVVTDNISAHSESGTISASDDKSSHNLFENNLIYGVYYASWSAKGNTPGFNTFRHNTMILTPFSRLGGLLNRADSEAGGRSSANTTVQDNLFYADHPNPSSQYLWRVDKWSEAIQTSSHNLFWRPGSTPSWTKGVTFHETDVRQEPRFVDPAHGDFSLAPDSPGKQAASDGKDIGIAYNEYLKKSWMRHVLGLPTQEKTPSGKRLSFATSVAHQYQVYVFIPESKPFQGIETFTIERQQIKRDYTNIIAKGWVGGAPLRWIYIGTHPSDGSLDISWTQSSSVGKLFIRQLPTVEEAYGWLTEGDLKPPAQPRVPSN